MEALSYKIGEFIGPLDVLLGLITKNKIDIFDIPIAEILVQYSAYINEMKENKLDVTAEFLTMAAELIYIKSKMLLPNYEDENEEDPREHLVKMLLEYKRYKEVLNDFGAVSSGWVNCYIKESDILPVDNTYEFYHNLDELKDAYMRLFLVSKKKAPPPVNSFKGIVGHQVVSVSSRIIAVLKQLVKKNKMKFSQLFDNSKSRSEAVATFLAVLELAKVNRIKIEGDNVKNYNVSLINKKKMFKK